MAAEPIYPDIGYPVPEVKKTFTQVPNFLCKSEKEMNHQIAKNHALSNPSVRTKCPICEKNFTIYYAL